MDTKTVPPPLVAVLREELRKLVDEEDLDKNLIAIEQVAARARQLFQTFKVPTTPMLRSGGGALMSSVGYDAEGSVMYASGSGVLPLTPNNNHEQFGATAIRNLMSLGPEIARAFNDAPDKLVRAIADARRLGMTDVAAELEKKLVGKELPGERPVEPEFPTVVTNGGVTVDDYLKGSGV